jgi:hypothetical protein
VESSTEYLIQAEQDVDQSPEQTLTEVLQLLCDQDLDATSAQWKSLMLAIREKHQKVQMKFKDINESVQAERIDLQKELRLVKEIQEEAL